MIEYNMSKCTAFVIPGENPIRVITQLPNTKQSSTGNGKTHKSTNR